jgi:outer membrane receptor protein involved in Fe transport
LHIRAATIVDGRASWTSGRFTLFGYARNLFNTFRLQFLFDPPTEPTALATAHDPREVGVGLEAAF